MENQHSDIDKKLDSLWKKHETQAIQDEEGDYISLKNINLAEHGLESQDFRTPGNQSLSPTSDIKYDNYFLRGSGNDMRLFRKRDYKRNV